LVHYVHPIMIHHLKRIAQNNTPGWVVLTIDLLLTAFSFGIASLVADAFSYVNFTALDYIIPLFTVLSFRFFAFVSTKSYTGIIRYTSTQDAVRIFFAVAISTFLILSLEGVYFIALGKHFLKPGVIVIDAFILITLLSGFRITFKLLYNQYAPSIISTARKEVIIYGAGEAGIIAKRSFEQITKYSRKVIAFIDDNPKLYGKSVEGIRIYPSNLNLESIITSRKSVELVIAINNLSPSRKKKIIET
jgi:FlaA1/EpsC-like NDP-sugar epimerase